VFSFLSFIAISHVLNRLRQHRFVISRTPLPVSSQLSTLCRAQDIRKSNRPRLVVMNTPSVRPRAGEAPEAGRRSYAGPLQDTGSMDRDQVVHNLLNY
jgi:hypothetical protein